MSDIYAFLIFEESPLIVLNLCLIGSANTDSGSKSVSSFITVSEVSFIYNGDIPWSKILFEILINILL